MANPKGKVMQKATSPRLVESTDQFQCPDHDEYFKFCNRILDICSSVNAASLSCGGCKYVRWCQTIQDNFSGKCQDRLLTAGELLRFICQFGVLLRRMGKNK